MNALTRLVVVALPLVVGSLHLAAAAEPTSDIGKYCREHPEAVVCGSAQDDEFEFGGGQVKPGGSGSSGSGSLPVSLPGTYTVRAYAPACTGNTRLDPDVICESAATYCQPAGQGLVQFWVWEATVDRATRRVVDPPGWVLLPATVCMGPEEAGVPVAAAIAGIVSRDLQELIVLKGVAHVDPKDTTLVNYETGFWTEAGRYVLDPVSILGHRVVVTATPKSYDWYFGDGEKAMDAGPGRRGASDVVHTYTRTGAVSPYVVITWTGTFTVDGGAPIDVIGTATTTGAGTPLQVKQARAELVSR